MGLHIVKGFLDDSVTGVTQLWTNQGIISHSQQPHRRAPRFIAQSVKVSQAEAGTWLVTGPQGSQQGSHLGDSFPGLRFHGCQGLPSQIRIDVKGSTSTCGMDPHDRHVMGHRIVHLPGDPQPLVENCLLSELGTLSFDCSGLTANLG